jgi:hypothetical protein
MKPNEQGYVYFLGLRAGGIELRIDREHGPLFYRAELSRVNNAYVIIRDPDRSHDKCEELLRWRHRSRVVARPTRLP